MIVCHVCGTENQDGAKFCEGCGVELGAPASGQTSTTPAATTPAVVPAADPPATMPPVTPTPPLEASSLPVEEPPLEVEETPAVMPPVNVPPVASEAPVSAPTATTEPDVKATMPDTVPAVSAPSTGAETSKPKVARLVARHAGATPAETYTLASEHMVVGRFDPSAGPVDIDLAGQPGEGYISRRHAELYLENGQWYVRDLGSTNGVYVKKAGQGQYSPRIIEPVALGDGDELAFGNVKFLFLYSSEA